MTDLPKRRRVSGWKVAGVFLGVLGVLALTTALWIRAVADRRWAAMEKETRALLEESRARDSARPVLRGEPIAGNAWDDYAVAILERAKFKGSTGVLGECVSRGPKANRAAVEALLAAHPAALESIRKGARRSQGQFQVDWEKGDTGPGLLATQSLANLAACQARFLAEAGRPREAAELLLDICQFARDVGHNSMLISELIALANYGIAFEELREIILSGKLTPGDLREVGRELELVDRAFPRTGFSMTNETVFMGCAFLRPQEEEDLGLDRAEIASTVWRFGFSTRLMQVDAFHTSRLMMKQFRDVDERPWSEVVALSSRLLAERSRSRNPFTRSLPGLLSCARPGREKRAQLRLLRVAAHYRATGETLDLDDPFGAKLLTEKKGQTLKVWSVGPDGMDDGGTGTFKVQGKASGADLVLEVER